MTPQEITLVQRTFRHVLPIGDTAASLFYRRLFALDPSLRAMFPEDLRDQGRKLMQMMAVAVQGLSRFDDVVGAVEDLGRRHATYGVKPVHYDLVGEALLSTLAIALGDMFAPDVRNAWAAAYRTLATTMQRAAYQHA